MLLVEAVPWLLVLVKMRRLLALTPWFLAPWTKQLCYLEEGDYAVISLRSVQIFDEMDRGVDRPVKTIFINADAVTKGGYDHFMLKEIFEQPTAVKETLESLIDPVSEKLKLRLMWIGMRSQKLR
jgi:glucosamine 6-phosphate synthetase-like amidotransferase/phosphosugar isomerase protein